ncbi:LIC_13387 family protein [Minwuia sp.]|uniref:LIC_13387 family protein n=1 Tax=Minwuia sp. TaxID=2493630 RepID=UPI003A954A98
MPDPLPLAAAGILALLGMLHLTCTLRDLTGKPRFFRPRDADLLSSMRETKVALAPGGRDYWTALLGFHISHSLAVLMLALLIVVASAEALTALLWLTISLTALYAFIAWRFWFAIPMWGCIVATALLLAGLIT